MRFIGSLIFPLLSSLACLLTPTSARAQTVLFSDTFDTGNAGGSVSSLNWPYANMNGFPASVPGRVNGYRVHQIQGSDAGHQKNHTASPTVGGSAFEVNNNPIAYAAYHPFDPAEGTLRIGAWVWDDVESRKPQFWPDPAQINGGLMLTTEPSAEPVIYPNGPTGANEIHTYGDFAFLGIQALVPASKPDVNAPSFDPFDPAHATQFVYQWRTKADGWNLTLDPNTARPVPRRTDFRNPAVAPQTWRHLEIEVRPYSGQVGDIRFFIDGVLVGQGRRTPSDACHGETFARIQIGSRFPEAADVSAVRPPYSYEHLWFDDVLLAAEAPSELPCPNPQLRFDADADGDVDQHDFAVFQRCVTGTGDPGGLYDCQACRCMNADADQDIDADDLGAFTACAAGPAVPANEDCDQGLPYP